MKIKKLERGDNYSVNGWIPKNHCPIGNILAEKINELVEAVNALSPDPPEPVEFEGWWCDVPNKERGCHGPSVCSDSTRKNYNCRKVKFREVVE